MKILRGAGAQEKSLRELEWVLFSGEDIETLVSQAKGEAVRSAVICAAAAIAGLIADAALGFSLCDPLVFPVIGALAAAFFYFAAWDRRKKRLRRRAADIEAEFPSMCLQLILLLNAGLVVSSAFERLAAGNSGMPRERMEKEGKSLYVIFGDIARESASSNISFVEQIYLFSKKCRSRTFIRFAVMVMDNAQHGSSLADKLEREREQLWSSRLSSARGRAKEAETKLCFPLMLLLVSLVSICTAPALLQM